MENERLKANKTIKMIYNEKRFQWDSGKDEFQAMGKGFCSVFILLHFFQMSFPPNKLWVISKQRWVFFTSPSLVIIVLCGKKKKKKGSFYRHTSETLWV